MKKLIFIGLAILALAIGATSYQYGDATPVNQQIVFNTDDNKSDSIKISSELQPAMLFSCVADVQDFTATFQVSFGDHPGRKWYTIDSLGSSGTGGGSGHYTVTLDSGKATPLDWDIMHPIIGTAASEVPVWFRIALSDTTVRDTLIECRFID